MPRHFHTVAGRLTKQSGRPKDNVRADDRFDQIQNPRVRGYLKELGGKTFSLFTIVPMDVGQGNELGAQVGSSSDQTFG
jgi:hypothetical protein